MICHHPFMLFLHGLFIEATATLNRKQLEKVKINFFLCQFMGCARQKTKKQQEKISSTVNKFHVSLEELAGIQIP